MEWQYWCVGLLRLDAMGRFMHAMRAGMLILVLPPFCICITITIMAYRRRNRFARD